MGKGPLFTLGRLVATPGARDLLEQTGTDPTSLLKRHWYGDWGDVCDEDKAANDRAVKDGTRIFSSYHLDEKGVKKIWVITEWNRSVTTLLLPSEY
jgi:hypothetical protein